MLNNRSVQLRKRAGRQSGIVLIVALIVLVAMTLAAIALVRSVSTNNMIAGNLAFKQAATHSGDTGVEAAVKYLAGLAGSNVLYNDDPGNGYSASGSSASHNPIAGQSWDAFWANSLAPRAYTMAIDNSGNTVSYVIDRLCSASGSPTGGAGCIASPSISSATGNGEESGNAGLNRATATYYRITVRIAGPRNTVNYIQSVVSM